MTLVALAAHIANCSPEVVIAMARVCEAAQMVRANFTSPHQDDRIAAGAELSLALDALNAALKATP